jgi:chromosome condensin MukBEF complex kleisin-like MukF subunit
LVVVQVNDITPTTAVLELAKLSRLVDELGYKLHDAERRAVNSEHDYVVAKAKALLSIGEGTVPEREAQATLATDGERLKAKLAEAELRILRKDLAVAEIRIDVGRSVVGVLRAEASVVR